MSKPTRYQRPTFEDALVAWKTLLEEHEYSTDLLWVLDENLCFERDPGEAGGVKLGIQTQFTPSPPESAKVIYHHFAETDARMTFYRLGASRGSGQSACVA